MTKWFRRNTLPHITHTNMQKPRREEFFPKTMASEVCLLIPGLPNDISARILASLPISHHPRLRATSRSWRSLLSTPPSILSSLKLRLPRHLLCLFPKDPSFLPPHLFDPQTHAWFSLPTIPCNPHTYGLSNFVPISLNSKLYVVGGSHFDARAYPVDRPVPSGAVYVLDLSSVDLGWSRVQDMMCPRGSFAWGATGDRIFVAGGGSRHTMFPSDGSRVSVVESFDVGVGEWRGEIGMPGERAGCAGWVLRGREEEDEDEFWVVGGYGGYRTVGGVFRADIYCRDGVVMGMRSGKWREIGDMWEEGERRKLGQVAVVEGENGGALGVFMLDQNEIFRYVLESNRWVKESRLRRKIPEGESCGFVAIDGELHVLTPKKPSLDLIDSRRLPKKKATLDIQVYNPVTKRWTLLTTSTPFHSAINFNVAAACTIKL